MLHDDDDGATLDEIARLAGMALSKAARSHNHEVRLFANDVTAFCMDAATMLLTVSGGDPDAWFDSVIAAKRKYDSEASGG